jgi:2-polyprenyl-3-methyl-5-hydroxy-6-metoxy-1,4-benzoquinol methylase
MTACSYIIQRELDARARQSMGISSAAIYTMVAKALDESQDGGGVLIDVGCGAGNLWPFVRSRFSRYIGIDVVRFEGFPADAEFHRVDLETSKVPLQEDSADVVAAVETIEHLENPRAFIHELVRLAKPGGWIIVTTPIQLSILSLLTLVINHRFAAFQDVDYPARRTALLEVDLRRIAAECALADVEVTYSHEGRIALTPWHYPKFLARLFPRAFSDNLLLIGRKPGG